MSRMIDVNMTEDSEWGPMSPYSMSLVMLQLLEQENCAKGSRWGQSRTTANNGESGSEEERITGSGRVTLLAL